jgi:hypothetical protein
MWALIFPHTTKVIRQPTGTLRPERPRCGVISLSPMKCILLERQNATIGSAQPKSAAHELCDIKWLCWNALRQEMTLASVKARPAAQPPYGKAAMVMARGAFRQSPEQAHWPSLGRAGRAR